MILPVVALLFAVVHQFSLAQSPEVRQKPLLIFGGTSTRESGKGFVTAVVPDSGVSAQSQIFSAPVKSAACLDGGRAVVAFGNVLHDGDPQRGSLSTLSLDGDARAMLPLPWAPGSVLVGGSFTRGLLLWDGNKAHPIGPALKPACVLALSHYPANKFDVVVGGCFTHAGSASIGGVVRLVLEFGTKDARFLAVGTGFRYSDSFDGVEVNALSTAGDVVFAGGWFTSNGNGQVLNNIAKWESAADWKPLAGGVKGRVHALAATMRDERGIFVFVGGHFCATDNPNVCSIAEYSEGLGWRSLGEGVKGVVLSLLLIQNFVFVGGDFQFTRMELAATNIAAWEIGTLNPGKWTSGGLALGIETVGTVSVIISCPCAPGLTSGPDGSCIAKVFESTIEEQKEFSSATHNHQKAVPHFTSQNDAGGGLAIFMMIVFLTAVALAAIYVYRQRQLGEDGVGAPTQLQMWRKIDQEEPAYDGPGYNDYDVGNVAGWPEK